MDIKLVLNRKNNSSNMVPLKLGYTIVDKNASMSSQSILGNG